MISFVLPTRDRPNELQRTAGEIERLGIEGAELVVVDNASAHPVDRGALPAGVRTDVVRLPDNMGTAARNIGARHATHDWIVMLDDDAHPLDTGVLDAVRGAGPEVGAIAGDIVLPDGSREQGGLPEVIVGCGAAIRRELFLDLGGYDRAFDYYAEEYDLCARLLAAGHRVAFDPRLRVLHRKVDAGRDFGAILHRLVRNNGWVLARFAPELELEPAIDDMLRRYARIAEAEGVTEAFALAQAELRATINEQTRSPLSLAQWERFTGLAAAGEALDAVVPDSARTAAVIAPGKNEAAVREAIARRGLIIVGNADHADVLVIGTLSPGPMLDAMDAHGGDPRVVAPWLGAMPVNRRRAAA